ncbi:unnamed protein product [Durusdinium trenchii]
MCLAVCPALSIWAVGMAGQQRKRLQAARLALCVALAAMPNTPIDEAFYRNPSFKDFCQKARINVEESSPAPAASSGGRRQKWSRQWTRKKTNGYSQATWGNESGNEHKEPLGAYEEDVQEEEEQNDGKCQGEHQSGEAEVPQETDEAIDDLLSKAKAGAVEAQVADIESPKVEEFEESKDPQAEAAEEFEDVEAEGEEEAYYPPAKRMRQKEPKREELKEPKEPKEPLKRETPHWLFVEELPDLLQGLQQETLVLASDGTQRRGMYNQADKALTAMLGDLSDEIVCHDDPNWQKFPQVGEEIKNLSDEEECLCVATLPPRRLWGVGVATKSQVRQKAAKLALAALIAFQMTESGEEIPDLSRTTAVADFLEEARAAKDDLWQSTLGDRA